MYRFPGGNMLVYVGVTAPHLEVSVKVKKFRYEKKK